MPDDTLMQQIRQRAYEIWLGEGCPQGRDRIHWLHAEAECRERLAAEHATSTCEGGLHERPADDVPGTRSPRRKKPTSKGAGPKRNPPKAGQL